MIKFLMKGFYFSDKRPGSCPHCERRIKHKLLTSESSHRVTKMDCGWILWCQLRELQLELVERTPIPEPIGK